MKLGVIGAGNMGTAIIKGYIASGADPETIFVTGHNAARTAAFAEETGIGICEDIPSLVQQSDIVMAAVKPKDMAGVLAEAAPHLGEEKILVSIAAGLTLADLKGMTDGKKKIIRVMPNTPAMVNEGMSALCREGGVSDEDFAQVMKIFEGIGKAEEVPEKLMDAVVGVSGSSPAFVYMFIEALADGAVLEGMPRASAMRFAAQTVLGSAKMVLETGQHPGELKDAVCSPAGTTIEGVYALEESGFRHAVIRAVKSAAEKSKNM